MKNIEIIKRCVERLGMTANEASWVAENLYTYCMPDFSEWNWKQIDECFRDVLWFKGKSHVEIEAAL